MLYLCRAGGAIGLVAMLWTRAPATAEAQLRAAGVRFGSEAVRLPGAKAGGPSAAEANDLEAYARSFGPETSAASAASAARQSTVAAERFRKHGRFFVARGQADVLAAAAAVSHDVWAGGRVLGRPLGTAPAATPWLRASFPFLHGAVVEPSVRCRRLAGAGDWVAVISPGPLLGHGRVAAAVALRLAMGSREKALAMSASARWQAPGARVDRDTLSHLLSRVLVAEHDDDAAAAAKAVASVEAGWAEGATARADAQPGLMHLRARLTPSVSLGPDAEELDEDDEDWLDGLLAATEDAEAKGGGAEADDKGRVGDLVAPCTGSGEHDALLARALGERGLAWR